MMYDDGSSVCVFGVPETVHYQSALAQVISSTGGLSIFSDERGNASNWIATDGVTWNIIDYVVVFFFLIFFIPLLLGAW